MKFIQISAFFRFFPVLLSGIADFFSISCNHIFIIAVQFIVTVKIFIGSFCRIYKLYQYIYQHVLQFISRRIEKTLWIISWEGISFDSSRYFWSVSFSSSAKSTISLPSSFPIKTVRKTIPMISFIGYFTFDYWRILVSRSTCYRYFSRNKVFQSSIPEFLISSTVIGILSDNF